MKSIEPTLANRLVEHIGWRSIKDRMKRLTKEDIQCGMKRLNNDDIFFYYYILIVVLFYYMFVLVKTLVLSKSIRIL